LTERRLLHNAHGQWESWPWAQLTGFYPDLGRVTLQLEANGVAPMRLKGPSTAQVAVFACWALDGRTGLRTHPQISTIGWP
jgi:hypothetical protein